ncbi:MAG: FecCD family ABC transporter permease [Eubacteriaceae bacterium]
MKETAIIQNLKASKKNRVINRNQIIGLILIFLILLVSLISVSLGEYAISLSQIKEIIQAYITGQTLSAENQTASTVLFLIRIPRIILAIMIGAALSASGAAYQGIFKNPMVSPDILGVTGGAGVGAAIALLFDFPTLGVHALSFLFGIGAVSLVLILSRLVGKNQGTLLIMVLSGVVISSIFSALTSLIKYLADADDKLPEITFWLMGSFARSGNYQNILIMTVILLIAGTPLFLTRWQMNVMSFGDEEAQSLGIDVRKTRLLIIGCASLLTASSVCLCGTIGWVGLIMPHITRMLVGPNYKSLLPITLLSGGLFMLIVDNVARLVVPGELPIGILTSLIGAPLFIYMLFKGRSDWS